MSATKPSAILILGCGYLGMRLLRRLLLTKSQLWATTRNKQKLNHIHHLGAAAVLFDINDSCTWGNLQVLDGVDLDIYFLLPPGQIDLTVLQQFVKLMKTWRLRRLLMTSSTVVYGSQLRTVDAMSAVDIDSPRAERQYAIEQSLGSYIDNAKIVRLAGLYGPDRIIGRQGMMDGQPLSGKSESYLNLIHVDDAADLLMNVMASETAAAIELGCDGRPVKRGQYYADLAASLVCDPPVFLEKGETGDGRKCDNRITVARTGWQPCHVDYRQSFQVE